MPTLSVAQSTDQPGFSCMHLVEGLVAEGRVALHGVEFEFNRSSLMPDSIPALIAARDMIQTLGGGWQVEGHTDNRGNRDYNQALSEARALAVRDWLVAAGVPAEQLTAAGFSFDRPVADNMTDAGRALNRRVELVGEVSPDMLGFGGPDGGDPCPETLISAKTAEAEAPPPPLALPDWSGAAGQEWLPFSLLMTTGYGGEIGWRGDRLAMPPGTQPQTCQAICVANPECAAFSFEPAGASFIPEASCALMGFGTEVNLRRNNSYFDGGLYYASGLKPDARLLTPESDAEAQQILQDLAEIAHLRATIRITAPEYHAPERWMYVTLEGGVAAERYPTYLEITELDDYAFDWTKSKSGLFVDEMPDGRSGQIWVPKEGDYLLRYVINHPTAALHSIVEQPLIVRAQPLAEGATSLDGAARGARGSTVEPGIDRPGMDIAQTPLDVADPMMCQAACAADPACRAWTYVIPGLPGDQAMCWTKSGVPEGYPGACCTSGVMEEDGAASTVPAAPSPPAIGADGRPLPWMRDPAKPARSATLDRLTRKTGSM